MASRSSGAALLRFDLTVMVIAESPKGNLRRAEVTIHKLIRDRGGAPTPLLEPGAVVDAELEHGSGVFRARGNPVPQEAQEFLGISFLFTPTTILPMMRRSVHGGGAASGAQDLVPLH
jgi:hypothetical protein